MLRGDDSGGIESMGEAAIPRVIDFRLEENKQHKESFLRYYQEIKEDEEEKDDEEDETLEDDDDLE